MNRFRARSHSGSLPDRLRLWRSRPAPVEIVGLPATELGPVIEQILHVYGAAFALPPYNRDASQTQAFAGTLMRHLANDDFRCCVAREDGNGRILGFTYGYTGRPGQWWYDVVAAAMEPRVVEQWLDGGFEFVELAVLPEAQGRGLGGRLHDALLDGQPHRAATLSTIQYETAALGLYRKRGWVKLLQGVVFPNVPEPYLVMGLDLVGWQSAVGSRQ